MLQDTGVIARMCGGHTATMELPDGTKFSIELKHSKECDMPLVEKKMAIALAGAEAAATVKMPPDPPDDVANK